MILICFWLDRYEPEPAGYRLAALGWGAVAAVVLSFIAEQLLFGLPGTNEFVNTWWARPLWRNLPRDCFLSRSSSSVRSEMDGILDGIIYGALVGIGFAFVEDISYYLQSLQTGQLGVTFFLRGVIGPFAHPLFTAATGIGIGIAVSTRRPAVRVFAPILGFLAAIVMHAIWNGSAFWDNGNGFLLAYGAIMLPLLVVILAIAIWARFPRGQDAHCRPASGRTDGLDSARRDPLDSPCLGSDVSTRVCQARWRQAAAAALRAYQQTMIEVAFLHNRAVNGTAPNDLNQRMSALLQRAAWLRPYVVFPPPAPRGHLPGCRNRGRSRLCRPAPQYFPTDEARSVARRWIRAVLGLRRAGRRTNVALLVVLIAAAVTGGIAFAAGTPIPARLATIAHGLFGLAVVLLVPWKTVIVRRAPLLRAASLMLIGLIALCVASGLVEVFLGYGLWWRLSPIQVHVGSACSLRHCWRGMCCTTVHSVCAGWTCHAAHFCVPELWPREPRRRMPR
jgi:RsiW-degrading membrane proteinase PrsW (M82 family)